MASKVPRHIAIILDGNRRYARKLGLRPWKGHEIGLKKLEDLFKWCIELGIKELTLYCFSTENFKRARKEVDYLFNLFWQEFSKIKSGKGVFKDKVKVNVIGRIGMFSGKMQQAMQEAMKRTEKNNALLVNFALAYGGRQEVVDALKGIIADIKNKKTDPKSIDEKTIKSHLYLKSEPDMVIRPGGEVRTSNFLMWQSVYSEWVFIDRLWPEFTRNDLEKCIGIFNKRERRFGK